MSDPADLVSVYEAANTTDAYLVKNLLLDAGIDATVSEENEPLSGLTITPPDVLVRREDLAAAQAIVDDLDQRQFDRATSEAASDDEDSTDSDDLDDDDQDEDA